MALYSPGRRRAIILLLLTSALLLTIDLRGSAMLDGARSLWSGALRPLESAADVVTRPVENAWRGITDYDDLERRYDELQADYEALRAEGFIARAVIAQNRQLKEELDLSWPGDYPIVSAYVVGLGPTNVDQTIQIDKGSNQNLCRGMPVLSSNWMIGSIIDVDADRAWVRLITDSQYAVSAKVVRPESIDPEVLPPGVTPVTTTVPPAPISALPLDTLPPDPAADPQAVDPAAATVTTTTPPTTTLPPPDPIRSTGALRGRGADRLPVIALQGNLSADDRPQGGDIVFTTGGDLSLAPPDVALGVVTASAQGTTDEGLLTEVQPMIDVDNVEFVSVMLYVPEQEAGSCAATAAG